MRDLLLQLLREHSYREGEFVLASGKTSRFYVDVRRTSLTAEGATAIGELLLDALAETGWAFDGAGGMTLGADPLTTAIAVASYRRGTPVASFIVRKEAKDHGAGRKVELGGTLPVGANVVVLDDTVTTGGSTLKAINAMRESGFTVVGAACVVDRMEGGAELLAENGVPLVSLFTLPQLAK
jgi:orotate phosphoribosyltransferase